MLTTVAVRRETHLVALVWIALTSLVSLLPYALVHIRGDMVMQHIFVGCFAGQFWQGDLYPRWCFDAQSGMGAPYFYLYPPLPFFGTALLYPLSRVVGMAGVYGLGLLLATLTAGVGCYVWLTDIVSPRRALLASLIYLLAPYRMEVVLHRSSYAETWCIALLPFLFMYVRRVAEGDRRGTWPLCATFGLMFLTNAKDVIVAVLVTAVYAGVIATDRFAALRRFVCAVAGGAALASVYLVPAVLYVRFLRAELIGNTGSFLTWAGGNPFDRKRLIATLFLALIGVVVLLVAVGVKRHALPSRIAREFRAWTVVTGVSAFLLLPVSAPIYASVPWLLKLLFPWRFQFVFSLALAWSAAVWLEWLAGRWKLSWAPYAVPAGMLVLSYAVVDVRAEAGLPQDARQLAAKALSMPQYRSKWTDEEHGSLAQLMRDEAKPFDRATIVSGSGAIDVTDWTSRGISLSVASDVGVDVALHQFYFPSWQANIDGIDVDALSPESRSGRMRLAVPAGRHAVNIRMDVARVSPWLVQSSRWVSALALAAIIVGLRRARQLATVASPALQPR